MPVKSTLPNTAFAVLLKMEEWNLQKGSVFEKVPMSNQTTKQAKPELDRIVQYTKGEGCHFVSLVAVANDQSNFQATGTLSDETPQSS